jgi:beta-glucosidase
MKRRPCLLVLLTLIPLVAAAGCGQATPTTQPTPVAETTKTATTAPSPTPLPQPTATPEPPAAPAEELLAPQGIPQETYYTPNTALPIEERVADLLARMTLAEKIGQMTLVEKGSIVDTDITQRAIGGLLSGGGGYPETNTPDAWASMVDGFQEHALQSRLGIPLIYGVDAVHGHNNVYGAVIFPHNVGLGAANDPTLMERIGRVTAVEMIATGIYWNYAPCVAVPQDIRWGRTYEGYGEDPELVSTLGAAYLRGLQGNDLAAPDTVLATAKHYVGDGGTAWGSSTNPGYRIDQGVTEVDEATLRAVHLPPYVAAIEAGAKNIMISYSSSRRNWALTALWYPIGVASTRSRMTTTRPW